MNCPVHHTPLICARCAGARGGRKRTRLHRSKLARWGRKGGRPKKNS